MPHDTVTLGLEDDNVPMPPTSQEERVGAARYVAARARALGWTRAQHEEILVLLFGEPNPVRRKYKAEGRGTDLREGL